MDVLSFLQTSLVYSLLLLPFLTMVLLLLWIPANTKNTAKVQLVGILILLVLGILTVDYTTIFMLILLTFTTSLTLWVFIYRHASNLIHLAVILLISALQITNFFVFEWFSEKVLTNTLRCIVPTLSMILLYPWIFGSKKTSSGRVLAIIIFVVQLIFVILNVIWSIWSINQS